MGASTNAMGVGLSKTDNKIIIVLGPIVMQREKLTLNPMNYNKMKPRDKFEDDPTPNPEIIKPNHTRVVPTVGNKDTNPI